MHGFFLPLHTDGNATPRVLIEYCLPRSIIHFVQLIPHAACTLTRICTQSVQEIKVCVATFNLGNAPLDATTLGLWIDTNEEFDIVAVGLQETWTTQNPLSTLQSLGSRSPATLRSGRSPLSPASLDDLRPILEGDDDGGSSPSNVAPPSSFPTTQTLEKHLGRKYRRLVETSRGEMKLVVFVRATPSQPVHSVEVSAENTGALGIGPNKGGLLVRFVHGVTSLCFISCHLEAHEGARHYVNRNRSCEQVLAGARVCDRALDATCQHHHTFFFGDLNYRGALFTAFISGGTANRSCAPVLLRLFRELSTKFQRRMFTKLSV